MSVASPSSSSKLPDISNVTIPPSIPKPRKKATVDELRGGLAALGLDTKGKKETLMRRLYNAFIRTNVATSSLAPDKARTEPPAKQKYRSFLCFDVEATCRAGRGDFDYPNEIIEFPVVLMRWVDDETRSQLEKVATFHSNVRPTWQPKLSEFCVGLTGVTQEMVDLAPTFPQVLLKLESWLDEHDLRTGDELKEAMWVTDGVRAVLIGRASAESPSIAMGFTVAKQLHITPTDPPRYPAYFLAPYLNIKQAVRTVLSETWRREQYAKEHPNEALTARALSRITTASHEKRRPKSDKPKGPDFHFTITGQVEAMGLGDFEGRQHCGLDDATNISRVLMAIAERSVLIEPNAILPHPNGRKRYPWMGDPGVVKWEEWMSTPRKPAVGDGEKVAEERVATIDWTLEQDASGRMVAVKTLAIADDSTREATNDNVRRSDEPVSAQTLEPTESISAEPVDVNRQHQSAITAEG